MAVELTATQARILNFIKEQVFVRGIPPTLAEIANNFGYKNKATVQQHLQLIEKKGFIRRTPGLSRSIEIVADNKLFGSQPVYGEVAAGNPLTVYQDIIDLIELPSIIKMPKDSFILKVKGDSLKDAYIFNGDFIIVNPNKELKKNKIIVAILDDAAVVKRYIPNGDNVELHSENPEYLPIIVNLSQQLFKYIGQVIGVYRTMV